MTDSGHCVHCRGLLYGKENVLCDPCAVASGLEPNDAGEYADPSENTAFRAALGNMATAYAEAIEREERGQ